MVDYEKMMRERDEKILFARYLGIVTTEIREGYAKGELCIRDDYKNMANAVHGGCIFTLADTIGGAAAASRGDRITTISSDFHYLSPALGTEKLIARAQEVKHGKKISVYQVSVSDQEGRLLAVGTFSYFNLPDMAK